MTATVIDLTSRVRRIEATCRCPQHRLWALADRVREAVTATEGELLVSRSDHLQLMADVLNTLEVVSGPADAGARSQSPTTTTTGSA